MHNGLTTTGSESLITWQFWRTEPPKPQITQRRRPRNVSLSSIPVLNAEVVDKIDVSRSSQLYPEGGPFAERRSGKADKSAMIAD